MKKTDECGEGGWTLAMKIDGHKVNEVVAFPEFIGLGYATLFAIFFKKVILFSRRLHSKYNGPVLLRKAVLGE